MIYTKEDIFKMVEDNVYFYKGLLNNGFIFRFYLNQNGGGIDPLTKKPFQYKEKRNVIKVVDENGKTKFITSLGVREIEADSLEELKNNFWAEIKDGWINSEDFAQKILYLEPMRRD